MIIKLIVLLACASGVAFANKIISFRKPGDDLEALCSDKSIDLTQISQLNSLASQLEQKPGSCSERNAAALTALRDLIKANTGNECSMESHNRFRIYYKKYLDTSTKELKDENDKLPSSLRKFAITYGLEVSGLCRANMVSILTNEAHKETDPQHIHAIRTLISETGPLEHLLAYTGTRPDDMVLPSQFVSQIREAQNKGEGEKIGLKLEALPLIKSVQVLCERRFKPIYQPVMLPVAHMANLGFAHRGPELKKALKTALGNPETAQDVAQWTRILLMCEGLDELELVESKEDKEQSEGNDSTMVSVCKGGACEGGACKRSSCEGGACKRGSCEGGACKRGSCPGGACKLKKEPEGEDLLSRIRVNADEIKLLVFKPNLSVEIPDKLVRSFDMRQVLSLAWLSTSRDERDNVRMIFFSKHFRKLMDDLVHYRLISFFGFLIGKIRESYRVLQRAKQYKLDQEYGHSSQYIATELVTTFNERVHELEPDLRLGDGEDCSCPDCSDCCTGCCDDGCCCCGDDGCCCGGGSSDSGCCFAETAAAGAGVTYISTRRQSYFCLSNGGDTIIIMDRSYDKRRVDNALKILVILILIFIIVAIIVAVAHAAVGSFG